MSAKIISIRRKVRDQHPYHGKHSGALLCPFLDLNTVCTSVSKYFAIKAFWNPEAPPQQSKDWCLLVFQGSLQDIVSTKRIDYTFSKMSMTRNIDGSFTVTDSNSLLST